MDNYNSISNPPKIKFDTIQFFRFIAALMVIIYHSTYYTSERLKPKIRLYDEWGFNAVSLFFVISGFVMIISSENLREKTNGWRIFAIKRIIRIVPIYWLLTTFKVLILLSGSFLILHHDPINISFILKSYFFIPAVNSYGEFFPIYNVGWTLNFEMFFYALFTVSLALRLNTILFLSVIFAPFVVLSFYNTANWPDVAFYFNPIVLNFLYGMIAAKLVLKNIKLPQKLAEILILLSLLYLFFPKSGLIEGYFANNVIILHLAAFLVIYGAASIENKWGSKIPTWLIFLGGASYSLYLIHPCVAPLASTVLRLIKLEWPWLSVVLGIIFSIAAGVAFYKFCEKPITRFFSKLAGKWKLI